MSKYLYAFVASMWQYHNMRKVNDMIVNYIRAQKQGSC